MVHNLKKGIFFAFAFSAVAFVPNFSQANEFTLSFGGDFGLSSSGNEAHSDAGQKNGARYPLDKLVSGIAPLWDADLNFANMEAVVTDRKLSAAGKKYVFKTHPQALVRLSNLGLNLYSTANNHSYDYNEAGALDTYENMQELEAKGFCRSAGVGSNIEEALSIKTFKHNGYTIAFAAIGILSENNTGHRAGENKAGTASYRKLSSSTRSGEDYDVLLQKMALVDAHLKILSIHFGTEGKTSLDEGQREDFMKAIQLADVDVVLGHHAHVVRPWEIVEHKGRSRVLFYGLGNYLHLGTAAADFGLYGKLHFSFVNGKLEAQALKLVALTQTHLQARPHEGEAQSSRINRINSMNISHFGRGTATAQTPKGASYAKSCWGKNLGLAAQELCL